MQSLHNLLIALQIIAALVMIGLVLVQHGRGADMGASFGSGASGSLFGATGSATSCRARPRFALTVFFAATLALAFFANDRGACVPAGVSARAPVGSRRRSGGELVPAAARWRRWRRCRRPRRGVGAVPSK